MLGTKEHYELLEQFEKDCGIKDERARKEPKHLWKMGVVYCHGETNEIFRAYSRGYAYGRCRTLFEAV